MLVGIVVSFFLSYMAKLEYFYIAQNADVITCYLAKELLFLSFKSVQLPFDVWGLRRRSPLLLG